MTRTRAPYKRTPPRVPEKPKEQEPGDMTGYATLGRAIGMMAKGMGV